MAGSRTNPSPALVLAKLIGVLVVTGVLAAGVVLPYIGGIGLEAKHVADQFLSKTCNLVETPPPQKTEVYARDGKTLIATIFKQDRQPVPLSSVPKGLQDALIATEDRRFYSHHGVDLRGLIRSAISTSNGDTQGGSTLTMQYVKQIRYYQAGENKAKQEDAIAQTIDRKMEDAKCALYIEGTLHESKATILDNYLNIAFFGENSYGIETAARTYFDKSVSQLSLPESAMLVGLLRAPTQYDPFINPDDARDRRNQVLQNLVDVHDLTQAQADRYKATPVSLATTAPPPLKEGCANSATTVLNVGFFCDYAVNWLLDSKAVTEAQLQTGGLRIVTTLDSTMQNSVQAGLTHTLSTRADMTAINPVIQPQTGEVLAMATSKRYGSGPGDTTLPIFTSYTAQGGSTYKLFPLLLALSTGVPSTWELATPSSYSTYPWTSCPASNGDVVNGDANETFNANEDLATATAKSSNTFYTGVADQLFGCNLQPIINMATRLGIQSFAQPSNETNTTVGQQIIKYSSAKALVLGDVATSPLELTNAYATVANDGRYNQPSPILSISRPDPKVKGKWDPIAVPRTTTVQAVNPAAAREAVGILTGDTVTDGTSAQQFQSWYHAHPDADIAGKTGTAPGIDLKTHKDDKNGALWFVGMTPKLVATTALINLDHPGYPASDLPGVPDPGDNAYGAYAAQLWLKAVGPSLAKTWTWPSADQLPGDSVPSLVGDDEATARSLLKENGYNMAVLGGPTGGVSCASQITPGSIAFYAPQTAVRGATITVCPSSGVAQTIYVAPKPKPKPRQTPTPNPTPNPNPNPAPTSNPVQPNPPRHPRRHHHTQG